MSQKGSKSLHPRRGAVKATVKMSDVGKMAGVSSMTVSNTFKFPNKVSPETRQKVLDAAAALGYIPNLIAGELASGRSRVVAVITPSIRNSDFADMIIGLESELERDGYHLIISVIERPDREYEAVRALIGRRVDGIVLTGIDRDEPTRLLLEKCGIPVVETWDIEGPFTDMGVGFNTHHAAYEASKLLVARNCRKIGCIAYDDTNTKRFTDRLNGFRRAMSEAGLQQELVATVSADSGFAGGKSGLTRLLERDSALDGVFCLTDVLAVGASFACMERQISIPEQLAIVGFGDYEISSALPYGLSSVHTPGNAIGAAAARMILARVQNIETDSQVEDVGYTLIRRQSC